MSASLEIIPKEILQIIVSNLGTNSLHTFSNVGPAALCSIASVSKTFNKLAANEQVWVFLTRFSLS